MNRTLLIGILVVGAVGMGATFTWPKYQDYQLVSAQLKEREQELENREAYFGDLRKVKEELTQFPSELAKVEAAIPDNARLPGLYDFLQSEAALSGLSLRSISALIEPSQQGNQTMRAIPVTLELTGSYGAIKELLSRLQIASRVTQLQSLTITRAQELGRFTVTLQLHAFSY